MYRPPLPPIVSHAVFVLHVPHGPCTMFAHVHFVTYVFRMRTKTKSYSLLAYDHCLIISPSLPVGISLPRVPCHCTQVTIIPLIAFNGCHFKALCMPDKLVSFCVVLYITYTGINYFMIVADNYFA